MAQSYKTIFRIEKKIWTFHIFPTIFFPMMNIIGFQHFV